MPELHFRFVGKEADSGTLNFYELSRSQYAAARMIYTLARYKETGQVYAKITDRVQADIRAMPTRQGSFVYSVMELVALGAVNAAVNVPLSALFTYMWDLVLPIGRGSAYAETISRERIREIEAQRDVALSQEETERLRLMRDIIESKNVSNNDAREILRAERDRIRDREEMQARLANIENALRNIDSDEYRDAVIRAHERELNNIPQEDQRKLAGKTRNLVKDIALPTKRSASQLVIGSAVNDNTFCRLDYDTALQIAEGEVAEEAVTLTGKIVRYDTDNGSGRFRISGERPQEFGAQAHFYVPRGLRDNLSDRVIDCMHFEEVAVEFVAVKSTEGIIKRLELREILEAEK